MSSWSETFFGVGGGGLSTAALRLPNWCRSGAMSPPPGRILFRAANARRGYAPPEDVFRSPVAFLQRAAFASACKGLVVKTLSPQSIRVPTIRRWFGVLRTGVDISVSQGHKSAYWSRRESLLTVLSLVSTDRTNAVYRVLGPKEEDRPMNAYQKSLFKPFDRSYWVVPERLLAGCYPGARNHPEALRRLDGIVKAGIRLVVNLMEADETDWGGSRFVPYEEDLHACAAKAGVSVEVIRTPIRDETVPSTITMRSILDLIEASIDQGKPVYVHCWGGRGRTGTVVGCFSARHGIASGNQALEKIGQLRSGDPTAFKGSPNTEEQREMVRQWPINDDKEPLLTSATIANTSRVALSVWPSETRWAQHWSFLLRACLSP